MIAAWLRRIGLIAIATIAVMRCTVFFAPRVVFDVDPAFDPNALGALGPAGSLVLDALLLAACATALAGEALAGRRIRWGLLGLAILPVPVVLWHGLQDAGDLWRGATWAAAALTAATTAHLARGRAERTLLVGLLVAVVVPLLARGVANVTYEHDDNLEVFEAQKDALLRDRGWEPGSAYALIFERRVRQRQPTGWFVTTNIYASFMAFGALTGLGLAVAARRAALPGGWTGLAALVALACAVALAATGSKGAILAALAGLALLLVLLFVAPLARHLRRIGPAVGALAVAAVLATVAVRGTVLPESFAGDRSLLFRWHYTVSSARILAEHPGTGVGPDGYQVAYVQHRVPRNPEEVASAHSVFWDWLATLGASGGAWVILVIALLVGAGRGLRATDATDATDDGARLDPAHARAAPSDRTHAVAAAVAVALLGLVPALLVEWRTVDERGLLVRATGIVIYLLLAMPLVRLVASASPRAVADVLAAAAITLVAHAQIEMTFTQPGAVVWLMAMLGVAGGGASDPGAGSRGGALAAVVPLALAVVLVVAGAVPAARMEARMLEAARGLWPLADRDDPPTRAEALAARREAARLLLEAHEAMPTALGPRLAAAEQLLRAAALAPEGEREPMLADALAHARFCLERGDVGSAPVVAIFAHERLAEVTGDPGHRVAAIALAREAVERDPNGLHARRRLGDLLWEGGRHDAARTVYRRVLEIDEAFALDPLKRLPDGDRDRIASRLAADP